MNRREKRELALSKIIVVVAALLGLAAIVWLAWIRPAQKAAVNSFTQCVDAGNPVQESYPEVCVTSTGERFTNPEQRPLAVPTNADDQEAAPPELSYLTISEWGVRTPLTKQTRDLTYTFRSGTEETVSFTFKRLKDAGICDPGIGVTMSRSTKQNVEPFNLENPEPVAHIGTQYYYLAYAGEPCTTTGTDEQKELAAQINGGDLNGAVRDRLKALEQAP
jgi:hypothetical protein